ncbi:MAG: hypothetical protein SPJ13_02310 [Bacteroidales bacterium]|nr:hypothetical protein [Bacteroidales bacterium]
MKCIFRSILLFVALALPMHGMAEGRGLWGNTFVSFGVGSHSYSNDQYGVFSQFGPRAQVSFGKWMFNYMGVKASVVGLQAKGGTGIASNYLIAEASLLFNPLRSFSRHYHVSSWDMSLYAGVGLWSRLKNETVSVDREFIGVAGWNGGYGLSKSLFLTLDVGAHLIPVDFDYNKKPSSMFFATLGLTYKISDNPYRVAQHGESRRFWEDWYAGLAAGCGVWAHFDDGILFYPEASVGLVLGKRHSVVWESRARLSGDYCFIDDAFFRASIMVDLMCNVLNLFPSLTSRVWNFSPYIGAGMINDISIEEADKFLYCIEGGVNIRRRLSGNNDIYFDFGSMLVPPRVSRVGTEIKATATLGWIYSLGRSNCR